MRTTRGRGRGLGREADSQRAPSPAEPLLSLLQGFRRSQRRGSTRGSTPAGAHDTEIVTPADKSLKFNRATQVPLSRCFLCAGRFGEPIIGSASFDLNSQALRGRYYYYLLCTGEEAESERASGLLEVNTWWVCIIPALSGSGVCALNLRALPESH